MKVKITTGAGDVVVGWVHGSGGLMRGTDTLDRLALARRRAEAGVRLPIFEPAAGCVAVHVDQHTNERTVVSLVGATIEAAAVKP